MTTEGIIGLYIETRNYGATAAFWNALGYAPDFETDHNSGQWRHPSGGPYLFIAERADGELALQPVVAVNDSTTFTPPRADLVVRDFEPQHWGVVEALLRDPDGGTVSVGSGVGVRAVRAQGRSARKGPR